MGISVIHCCCFIALLVPVCAVMCYQCKESRYAACSDTFDVHNNSTLIQIVQCNEGCMKWVVYHDSGSQTVERGCAAQRTFEDRCSHEVQEQLHGSHCYCSQDLCNQSSIPLTNSWIILLPLLGIEIISRHI
ncbi:uncharacterized protein LOC106181896 [Lingula anatina]|uniref:Uncharacterized protein LOC106181896 n=1 Tax=Lingula anatina TaxID=7574 RepID=A0A1S3KI38_LINAN|nr:uncharacterized protein LOC106181896 [Lingula anatina]|eukprot:XP_013421886.1 uncharacterized protein LOC106181896 [Lingula anatina]